MRLIDADALLEYLGIEETDCSKCKNGVSIYGYCSRGGEFQTACYAIDIAPTVDAVPVVRCRDCKHYQFADNRAFGFPVKRCEWTGFEDVDDEDFCSRGERMDGKGNGNETD